MQVEVFVLFIFFGIEEILLLLGPLSVIQVKGGVLHVMSLFIRRLISISVHRVFSNRFLSFRFVLLLYIQLEVVYRETWVVLKVPGWSSGRSR